MVSPNGCAAVCYLTSRVFGNRIADGGFSQNDLVVPLWAKSDATEEEVRKGLQDQNLQSLDGIMDLATYARDLGTAEQAYPDEWDLKTNGPDGKQKLIPDLEDKWAAPDGTVGQSVIEGWQEARVKHGFGYGGGEDPSAFNVFLHLIRFTGAGILRGDSGIDEFASGEAHWCRTNKQVVYLNVRDWRRVTSDAAADKIRDEIHQAYVADYLPDVDQEDGLKIPIDINDLVDNLLPSFLTFSWSEAKVLVCCDNRVEMRSDGITRISSLTVPAGFLRNHSMEEFMQGHFSQMEHIGTVNIPRCRNGAGCTQTPQGYLQVDRSPGYLTAKFETPLESHMADKAGVFDDLDIEFNPFGRKPGENTATATYKPCYVVLKVMGNHMTSRYWLDKESSNLEAYLPGRLAPELRTMTIISGKKPQPKWFPKSGSMVHVVVYRKA